MGQRDLEIRDLNERKQIFRNENGGGGRNATSIFGRKSGTQVTGAGTSGAFNKAIKRKNIRQYKGRLRSAQRGKTA